MVKIYINKLGRIRDAEIDVKPMLVFTGNSGLGKSYTAFLVDHIYNVIANNRIKYFVQERTRALGEQNLQEGFTFKFKDLRLWMNQDASQYLGYLTGNKEFKCDVNYVFEEIDDNAAFRLWAVDEEPLTQVYVNEKSMFFPSAFRDWEMMYTRSLTRYLTSALFGKDTQLLPILMPPARAAFMGAKNALQAFNGIGMYAKFINIYDYLTDARPRESADEQFYHSMIRRLTGGELELENGQTYLRLSADTRIPISAAASSIKELTALLLLIQKDMNSYKLSVLFEEPEAHVHPMSQDLVADLIARCFNRGMQFQITTHSDFILGRFNQLIRLGNLRKKNPEKFKQFCKENRESENLYFDNEQVGAYYFVEQDGKVLIKEQDITNGIPYTTFHEIINRQEKIDDLIEQYMEE